MKSLLKTLIFCLTYLPIFFVQNVTAETGQEEPTKRPDCRQDSFVINFLPNTKILYLRVNQDCNQLVKELGNELRKSEYNSNDVAGYVLDLQQSKLSNWTDSISGLASIFFPTDTPLEGGMYYEEKLYSVNTGRKYYQSSEIKEDYLQDLLPAFKIKPLVLLTGEATDKIADSLALSFAQNVDRSVWLLGADIKGGLWTNSTEVENVFIGEVSKHFTVSNPVTSYLGINKRYLKYLDYLNNCAINDYTKWVLTAQREVMSRVYYPGKASRRGIEGDGKIEVVIFPSGQIAKAKVVYTTGNEYLDQAMLEAAKGVKIQPLACLKADAPRLIGVPFRFKLLDEVPKIENSLR